MSTNRNQRLRTKAATPTSSNAKRRLEGPTTANFIDLYKRGCFVLEAKQSRKRQKQLEELRQLGLDLAEIRVGSGQRGGQQWDTLMRSAREQAENYAKRLPPEEGWPPFLIVVDIGHVIELYADFSLQGKHYAQFPDRQSYRIYLEDLRSDEVGDRLRLIWTDPQALNPARRTAEVTREIAELLAKLSSSLETRMLRALPSDRQPEQLAKDRHAIAEKVALFLMRCLFTMFAEDVGLLKRDSFAGLLREYQGQADRVHHPLQRLWKDMNTGGFSPELHADILKFNGGLFRDSTALEITEDDLQLLTIAAARDWKHVEPAIFGTLLERALDPRERHRLGAHYTPRAYVERLVVATIIDPLTQDWRNVRTAAAQLMKVGDQAKARAAVQEFHRKLCATRVLDPACGTGNFLYVSMELMKRLEGEVLEVLIDLGERQYVAELEGHTVDPHQFLGLEINPRAVAIAELVLWIGYLQWHFRTRGRTMPAEPALKNFANIREQDAVLDYDSWDVLRDENQRPVTRWDGITYKLHLITGEEIPDAEARTELRTYLNPKPAKWPQADFIIGNPPFIGTRRIRTTLGDDYVDALRSAYPAVRESADFVMYWWFKAAQTVSSKRAQQFGLITTNSITQDYSRPVLEAFVSGPEPKIWLTYAVTNHPWVENKDGAAVRIAMTVGVVRGSRSTNPKVDVVKSIAGIERMESIIVEKINSRLRAMPDIGQVVKLIANSGLCYQGVVPAGRGFKIISQEDFRFYGSLPGKSKALVRPYILGKDLTRNFEKKRIIDAFGLSEEEFISAHPTLYQWVLDRVRPERLQNKRKSYREKWWLFAEPRPALRIAKSDIRSLIATPYTAKYRIFSNVESSFVPDAMVYSICIDDPYFLACLSSQIHLIWCSASTGTLEDRPRYNSANTFDPFPFPDAPEELKARIRNLGERLDTHRKEVLEKHKQLTMTGLYNVLEKVRPGEALTDAERDVYDAGLVGVLKQIHDDLDAAVAEAYGWPADLSDEEILERLVALNHERAVEEAEGKIRWLRPEFQAPKEAAAPKAKQIEADLLVAEGKAKKPRLPVKLPDQVAAIRAALADLDDIVTPRELSRYFSQGRRVESRVEDVLRTLALLGQAEQVEDAFFLSE